VSLSDADLSGADLRSADLQGASLSDADLSGADLRSADLTAAKLSGARLCGAIMAGARGGCEARVQVKPADGTSLYSALKVGNNPVVVALTEARALRLRSVAVANKFGNYNCAKHMEVLTGPAACCPWTSVANFTSSMTKQRQTFPVSPNAPALGGFIQVLVHDTYDAGPDVCAGRSAYVNELELEGEACGPTA
jgi:hypothetical protein